MKKIKFLTMLLAVLSISMSCTTSPEAGTLPRKWWKMNRGEIQNYYRRGGKGDEANVVIFIGKSDSSLNIDEWTAVENARMDAAVQLSRFLSQKVTNVSQTSRTIVQEKFTSAGLSGDEITELMDKFDQKFKNYTASVSSTQFSSFKEEASHVEDNKGQYKAWVCYSISDQVLKETRELQTEAFQSLMEETEKYREIMSEIQEIIAQQMMDNILTETDL